MPTRQCTWRAPRGTAEPDRRGGLRKFLTSLLAFVIAGFAGGIVAQLLAVWTGAAEEYIVVFAATALIAIVATIPFFVAQFFGARAINRTGAGLLVILVLALLALVGWTFSVPAAQRATGSDMQIIAGLFLPGLAIIIVQWLIVRGLLPRATEAPRFGRGSETA